MQWISLVSAGWRPPGFVPLHEASTRSYTIEEVAKHNTSEDVWMAIRGKVYNLTAYLPLHPGNAKQLMRGAGKDATKLFDSIHSWVSIDAIVGCCFVGNLIGPAATELAEKRAKVLAAARAAEEEALARGMKAVPVFSSVAEGVKERAHFVSATSEEELVSRLVEFDSEDGKDESRRQPLWACIAPASVAFSPSMTAEEQVASKLASVASLGGLTATAEDGADVISRLCAGQLVRFVQRPPSGRRSPRWCAGSMGAGTRFIALNGSGEAAVCQLISHPFAIEGGLDAIVLSTTSKAEADELGSGLLESPWTVVGPVPQSVAQSLLSSFPSLCSALGEPSPSSAARIVARAAAVMRSLSAEPATAIPAPLATLCRRLPAQVQEASLIQRGACLVTMAAPSAAAGGAGASSIVTTAGSFLFASSNGQPLTVPRSRLLILAEGATGLSKAFPLLHRTFEAVEPLPKEKKGAMPGPAGGEGSGVLDDATGLDDDDDDDDSEGEVEDEEVGVTAVHSYPDLVAVPKLTRAAVQSSRDGPLATLVYFSSSPSPPALPSFATEACPALAREEKGSMVVRKLLLPLSGSVASALASLPSGAVPRAHESLVVVICPSSETASSPSFKAHVDDWCRKCYYLANQIVEV